MRRTHQQSCDDQCYFIRRLKSHHEDDEKDQLPIVGAQLVTLGRIASVSAGQSAVMFHLDGQVRFNTGQRGQNVVEDLFGGGAELSTTCTHL